MQTDGTKHDLENTRRDLIVLRETHCAKSAMLNGYLPCIPQRQTELGDQSLIAVPLSQALYPAPGLR